MEKLKTFKEFINEALLPSQFREFVKSFNRDRYKEIFQKYKEKYDGDRNAYRIYLPLITEKKENPIEEAIKKFLAEKDYEILDYFKGTCKFKTAKNPTKIGQVLTRAGATDLMKKFVEDPERKKGVSEELMVVISRHPYDIAGSDTDRNWTNCMTMALTPKHPRIKQLKAELKKLKKDDPKRQSIENRIQNYGGTGMNARFLIHEVEQGSLMSYLIKKDDKNINNPLAVLNIKPYVKGKEIYLNACLRSYGVQNADFKKTVVNWLEEVNADKKGIFSLNPKVYNDSDVSQIYSNIDRSVDDVLLEEKWKKTDINKQTELWMSRYHLNSLKGIEKFKNLRRLHIENNNLTSLEGIENCTKLTNLHIHNNKITSLEPLRNCTNLVTLDCYNNKIESLKPLKNLTKLETLNCFVNELTSLEGLEHLYKLKFLALNNNKLTSLKGIDNLNLTYLDCQNNRLESIKEVKNLINLETLIASQNRLTNLEGIGNLTKLYTLGISNNQLKNLNEIDPKKLKNLVSLSCEYNPIENPYPLELYMKYHLWYGDRELNKFKTYEFQKEFLTKYPKRANDLYAIGHIDKKILKEYKKLFKDDKEWENYIEEYSEGPEEGEGEPEEYEYDEEED